MSPTDQIRITHRGAIRASLWVDKRTRYDEVYLIKRPIPPDCREYMACEVERIPEPARTEARAILRKHPKTRKIIAWTNPHPLPEWVKPEPKPFALENE